MRTIRRTLFSLLLATACTLGVRAQENQSYILHTIEKGQSLYSISSMYGVSQSDIIKLNPGSDQRIYVGHKLRIPRKAPNAMQETFHTIESGETLYRLSQRYGVSVQAICKANPGLSVVNFHAGEVIRIPVPTPETQPATPEAQPKDTITLRAEVKPRCREMHKVKRKETVYSISRMYGITEQELYDVFEEDIRLLGEHNGMGEEETRKALKDSYDGYHFTANCPDLYNPFSLLNAFSSKELGSYWFETGTPTFLIQLLKQGHYNLYNLYHEQVSKDMLGDIDNVGGNPLPMLYQSGYLTLKGYDREFGTYTLGFPNREVAEGFNRHLLLGYAKVPSGNPTFQIQNFVLEVRRGDTDAFLQRLQSFFADTPYELARDLELHYQNVLFIVFKLLGFYVQVEYHTSRGRIDLVLKTADYIYVMEFKLEGTAEEALQQIEDKHYALPFATDQRRVYKVGVNFSKDKRNIEKWLVKEA